MAQHEALDRHRQQEHHGRADDEGQHIGQDHVVKAQPARQPFGEAGHGQGGHQHHRALREVEDAGRLENQHKAQADQGIQHAAHQAAKKGF
ncbi:hypothetical protein D3C72_2037420 [compost metagenome]